MEIRTSMRHRGSRLANAASQLAILQSQGPPFRFADKLRAAGNRELRASAIEILQCNLGKLCNMTCVHCHVDAGPDRRELMDAQTAGHCLRVLENHPTIHTLDLTGGAPEMNPHFRELVRAARGLNRHVIDRCNLTILLAKGFEDLPEFLAEHEVEIVASLPCYLEENTDSQRGTGAYAKSIEALVRLNQLGYGEPESGRILTLVYNPVGPQLPPNQAGLEAAYRRELQKRFNVQFNRLFTIANMPISRYLEFLVERGHFEQYMQTLVDAFNPAALAGLMCRNTLSVGWDGRLFDCDFNQMLELPVSADCPQSIADFDLHSLVTRRIVTGEHCLGCTAGSGSGCQGAIV